jgi:hypothetical protein
MEDILVVWHGMGKRGGAPFYASFNGMTITVKCETTCIGFKKYISVWSWEIKNKNGFILCSGEAKRSEIAKARAEFAAGYNRNQLEYWTQRLDALGRSKSYNQESS